ARFPLGTILTAAAVAGPLMGIVALQFYSVLLGWTGRLFGGAAPFRQIRTTVAWAEAPIVATLGLLIPATLVLRRALFALGAAAPVVALPLRSEEHTSELQSQSNLVCRLLLEKKNDSKHKPGGSPATFWFGNDCTVCRLVSARSRWIQRDNCIRSSCTLYDARGFSMNARPCTY